MMESSTSDSAKIAIDNAIDLFDEIFYEIAPIDSYNEPNKGDKVKIPLKNLSDRQCHVIKQFSGYLTTARAKLTTASPSKATASPSKNNEAALVKKINCLREYLVNELTRSEAAEQELKKKEEELVTVTVERDKLLKKLASASHANNNSSNQGTTPRTIANVVSASVKSLHGDRVDSKPESYVNCYIRKPFGSAFFFGLVAQYDTKHAYFQIVYEDADYEDLSHAELRKVLWTGSTPNSKKEACMKHAKLLGIITEAQYAQMVEANKHSNASAGSSASSSSGSLHSAGASSSSSMVGHVTAGRSTRQTVSAFDGQDSHTVSADDDLENTSEPAHSPTASDRGSPISLPKETSERIAAPSGRAVPTRPIVGMVSDMSTGTDGDSRDSVASLRSPGAAKTLSAAANAAPNKATTASAATPNKASASAAAPFGSTANSSAPKSSDGAPLAGELPQLTQLQAMLKATPAAALSSVTSSEKVKPPAKSGLYQQQLKFSQTSTSSAEAVKPPTSASFSAGAAPTTSSGVLLSKQELYYMLSTTNSQTAPPPSSSKPVPSSAAPKSASMPANPAPKTAPPSSAPTISAPKLPAQEPESDDSADSDVVFITLRSSPAKPAGSHKVGQSQQGSHGSKGNNSASSSAGVKAGDGKQSKRKADVLTGKDALPQPPSSKKQNTTAASSGAVKAGADYVHVVE